MGVQMVPVAEGVRIERVDAGQPAERAGIKVGDVVTRLGEVPVTTEAKFRDVLGTLTPGDKVKVALKRDGKELTIDCALAAERTEGGGRGDRGDRTRQQQEDQPSLANWECAGPALGPGPSIASPSFLSPTPIRNSTTKFRRPSGRRPSLVRACTRTRASPARRSTAA